MLGQYDEIESRLEEIEQRFSSPEVAGNPEAFRELMREHHRLLPIVEKL